MGPSRQHRVRHLVAWIFGAMFVWSGYLKVRDPQLFLMHVRGFRMLPDPFAAWLALSLPWLEIFCGLGVIIGCLRRGGLLLLIACLVTFIIVLMSAWMRGLDIECGCFGDTFKTTVRIELVLDIVLLMAGAWLARGAGNSRCA